MATSGDFSVFDDSIIRRLFGCMTFRSAWFMARTCRRFAEYNPVRAADNWNSISRAAVTGFAWLVCRMKRHEFLISDADIDYAILHAVCTDDVEVAFVLLMLRRGTLIQMLAGYLAAKGRIPSCARVMFLDGRSPDFAAHEQLVRSIRSGKMLHNLTLESHWLAAIYARNERVVDSILDLDRGAGIARMAADIGDPNIAMFFAKIVVARRENNCEARPVMSVFAARYFERFPDYEPALRMSGWISRAPNTLGLRFAQSRPIAAGTCCHVYGRRVCAARREPGSKFCSAHFESTLVEIHADDSFVYLSLPHEPEPIGALISVPRGRVLGCFKVRPDGSIKRVDAVDDAGDMRPRFAIVEFKVSIEPRVEG